MPFLLRLKKIKILRKINAAISDEDFLHPNF